MSMETRQPGQGSPPGAGAPSGGESVVYVMPANPASEVADDSIDLTEFWRILWSGKWIIAVVTTLIAVLSVVYALGLTHWYRAEVLLAPADSSGGHSGLAGELGGLASLAGINLGGGGTSTTEALAVLRSRSFTEGFIEDENLMPVLFADKWDAKAKRWINDDPARQPDVRDAVKFFGENVRKVQEDRETGLVTLAIEWTDPKLAARWATELVARLNDYMRSRALKEAQTNVDYLQSQMTSTSVVALQQSISQLLQGELQKLMLARGNKEYAFRVIDPAQVPTSPSRPNRRLIVMSMTAVGGLASVFLVLVLHFVRFRFFRTKTDRESRNEPLS